MAKKKIVDTGHPDLFEEAAKQMAEQENARRLVEEKSKKPLKGTTPASSRGYVDPDWHVSKGNSVPDFKLEGEVIQTPVVEKEEPVKQEVEPKVPQKRSVDRMDYEKAMWTLYIFNQLLTDYASMKLAKEEISQAKQDIKTYKEKVKSPGPKYVRFGEEYIRAVHNRNRSVQADLEEVAEYEANRYNSPKKKVLYHAKFRYIELVSKINEELERE